MEMTQITTWADVGRLAVIIGFPLATILIGFLVYLRGHFVELEKDRQIKIKELNENKEMYIKMIANQTVEGRMVEIRALVEKLGDRVEKLSDRVNELFTMLRK